MKIEKVAGRPPEMTIHKMERIADALKNNYSIGDACEWAGISKSSYYRYMNSNVIFATKMNDAIDRRNKVSVDFGTHF